VSKLIAVLEDDRGRVEVMAQWLKDRLWMYDHFFSDDPDTLIAHIRPRLNDVLVVSLDHDLHSRPDGNTEVTGMRVAEFLATIPASFPVLIHSTNEHEAGRMKHILKQKGWSVRSVVPFDDTNWIGVEWYPTLKKALRSNATPAPIGNGDEAD
jgi:hypothetical protein